MILNKIYKLTFLFSLLLITYNAQSQKDTVYNLNVEVSGSIRTKYEYNFSTDKHRFNVRNARFSLSGFETPFLYYKAEVDLCDEGVMKMLDAYIRVDLIKDLNITLGQMKIPFSTDNLRSPHQLNFSNRSFIAKRISKNLRDIGALFSYKVPVNFPFNIDFGMFNGSGLNNPEWVNAPNYAFRTSIGLKPFLNISGNYYTGKMDGNNVHLYNIGSHITVGKLFLDFEIAQKNTTDTLNNSVTAQSFFVYGLYHFEINKKIIKRITPAIRYDAFDSNINKEGFEPGRITAGLTFGFSKLTLADLRFNYEKCFYKELPNLDDKITAELIVKF